MKNRGNKRIAHLQSTTDLNVGILGSVVYFPVAEGLSMTVIKGIGISTTG
jgi:hypothetical protein